VVRIKKIESRSDSCGIGVKDLRNRIIVNIYFAKSSVKQVLRGPIRWEVETGKLKAIDLVSCRRVGSGNHCSTQVLAEWLYACFDQC
jgi:hypothetical protein